MPSRFPIYLATLRKQIGFTQTELAALLSISGGSLSRIESQKREPTLQVLLASEVIFLKQSRHIFPKFYGDIEDGVMAAAKALYDELEARNDLKVQDKLRHLEKMIERAEANDPRL